jgi:thiamine-phosphate pyrophosphorylase
MHKNNLPKYFLFVDKYEKNILKNDITNLGIIYRNYSKKQNESDIYRLRSYCNKKKIKFYISNNLKLAVKFKTDGIYIPSFNKRITFNKVNLNKNFKIIGSAHNQIEIKKKLDQGCEAIFLSPLFKITKNKKYLGVCRFKLLTLKYEKKFIALGGIRKKNINTLRMLNIYGMAGITYLKKNRPKFLGRFL